MPLHHLSMWRMQQWSHTLEVKEPAEGTQITEEWNYSFIKHNKYGKKKLRFYLDFHMVWGFRLRSPHLKLDGLFFIHHQHVCSNRRRRCVLSSPLCLLSMWPSFPPKTDVLKCSPAPSTVRPISSWRHCCKWVPTSRWWTSLEDLLVCDISSSRKGIHKYLTRQCQKQQLDWITLLNQVR